MSSDVYSHADITHDVRADRILDEFRQDLERMEKRVTLQEMVAASVTTGKIGELMCRRFVVIVNNAIVIVTNKLYICIAIIIYNHK